MSGLIRESGSKVIVLANFVDLENRKTENVHRPAGADYFFDKSGEFENAVAVLRGTLPRVCWRRHESPDGPGVE